MAVEIAQFWNLVAESHLLGADQITKLKQEYSQIPGAGQGNSKVLSEWLIEKNVFSRYQATILLAGRAGPFIYGDYRIYDRLTEGPFAQHFRAVHAPSGHPALLYFVTGETSDNPARWVQLSEQISNWSRVSHPHLRQLYEAVDLGGFKFVAAEDARGVSLDTLMEQRGGRLAAADAAAVIYRAAEALQELHAAGLAHGHLRPDRLLDAKGVARVIQHPLELGDTPRRDLPEEQARLEADYMAPELARAGKSFDMTTDVYALGCCFYHLLTSAPPFAGGDVQNKMQRHASEAIKPLNTQGVPSQIAEVVTYMMAKNVSVRYANMQLVAQKLHPLLSAAPPAAPAPASTLARYQQVLGERQEQTDVVSINPFAAADTEPTAPPPVNQAAVTVAGSPAVASARQGRRASRSKLGKFMPLIIGVLVLGVGGGVLLLLQALKKNDGQGDVTQKDGGQVKQVKNSGGTDKSKDGKEKVQKKGTTTKKDDGQFVRQTLVDDPSLPWASPTDGQPIDLKMMPPGGQVFLVARPEALLAAPQGAKVLSAFGPALTNSRAQWEAASGFSLGQVRELVMGLYDNGEAFPRPAFRVTLATPHTRATLLAKWGNPAPKRHESGVYYPGPTWSFFLPKGDGEVTTFAMGAEADIKDVVEFDGAAPPLRRGMGPLLAGSDRNRHLSIVFAPNFVSTNLLRDGRKLFFGEPRKARLAFDWFMADSLDAGLVSLHFGDQFYWELRAHATLQNDKQQVADGFGQRINQIPDRIEEYIAALNPHRHWRLVANRYPGMIRYLSRHVRTGVEWDEAVVNCRLPGVAAHNLLFGGEMLLVSAPGGGGGNVGPAPQKPPQNINELLTKTFDVDIPQNDLNLAVDEMVKGIKEKFAGMPFDFQVKILGADLMADGITRNQAIRDFKMENKPLSEVFTRLVMTANGDQKDPTAASQKLIWVIAADPANAANQIMLLTTRKAAASKGYKVPAPFQSAE